VEPNSSRDAGRVRRGDAAGAAAARGGWKFGSRVNSRRRNLFIAPRALHL